MFDWLFEGRPTVYLVLGLVAAALVAVWYAYDRRRRWLYAVAGVLALVGLYALLDRLVETRREQITRKLQEMAEAVKKKDAGRIFEHISDRFELGGLNKTTFRQGVEARMKEGWIDELVIWDLTFLDDQGKVSFMAKPKGRVGENVGALVRGRFVLETGQWRLQSFEVFPSFVESITPFDVVPYLK